MTSSRARIVGSPSASTRCAVSTLCGLPMMSRKNGGGFGVAALSGSREELVGEAADTIFHLLVLLDAKGVALDEVLAELDRRDGTSGIAEKASRGQ